VDNFAETNGIAISSHLNEKNILECITIQNTVVFICFSSICVHILLNEAKNATTEGLR